MFERAVLHLDLDAFFVSVELLRQPELRGKPVIVGGLSDRAVVSSCSYEARKFGVRSAMPVKAALRLCPEAVVLRGDMSAYGQHSRIVTRIIADAAPLFEKASIDEFYVDLSGMDKYFGCWKWSQALRQRIMKETGLPLTMALSVNKTVSKIGAGEAKPNGELLIPAGTERAFLAPLAVGKMPSIGRETQRKLALMGIHTLGQLAEAPAAMLEREFGKHGSYMIKKARGEDDSAVSPYREQKSISTERTFHTDIGEIRQLRDRLTDLVTRLAFELRQDRKHTACVAVKIRYPDFSTFSKQRKVPLTARDSTLMEAAQELFGELYDHRRPLRLMGVRFSDLSNGQAQAELFAENARETQLLQQLDHIRKKFGESAVVRGVNARKKKKD